MPKPRLRDLINVEDLNNLDASELRLGWRCGEEFLSEGTTLAWGMVPVKRWTRRNYVRITKTYAFQGVKPPHSHSVTPKRCRFELRSSGEMGSSRRPVGIVGLTVWVRQITR